MIDSRSTHITSEFFPQLLYDPPRPLQWNEASYEMPLQGFCVPSPQDDGIPGRIRGSLWPSVSSSPRLPLTTHHSSYDFPVNGLSNSPPTPQLRPITPSIIQPLLPCLPSHRCTRGWEPWPSVSLCNSLYGVFSFSIKDFISIDLQRPHISSAAKTNRCHMSQINPSKDSKELMNCSLLTLCI